MAVSTVIGVDIGGTKSALGLYEIPGFKLITSEKFSTDAARGFPAILKDVVTRAEAMRRPDTVGIGIGVPGLVSQAAGVIKRLPNIPNGNDFPLKEHVEHALKMKVSVDNDSNCFTLGEALEGAGTGEPVVIGITLGTGVGGGIVIDGKLYHGAEGFAGEFGHALLLPGDPPVEDGNTRGEVEQFLSGSAMHRRCTAAKKPEDLLEGEACAFLHPEIVREAAWLCASLTHILNPSVIVFGGSTGRALKTYLHAIEEELTAWILPGTPLPRLAIGKLSDAATRGAAMLVQ
ncbi:MAG: ROK family protein [Candidatus Peribacteraceae bacterium]|jgi:predicted NBD/HSP70 family sugar kinase